ncbi:MAG TPA: hypothetical protein VN868_10505 [Terriglobales bacterium]|nr:hypothetical protein [Terriglobales bacterium]
MLLLAIHATPDCRGNGPNDGISRNPTSFSPCPGRGTWNTLRNRAGTLSRDLHGTTSDLLLVYAPGSSPDHWPDGMAKFVPAGSDLVFQIHYTTNGTPGSDQSSIGLVFARKPPAHGSSLCN